MSKIKRGVSTNSKDIRWSFINKNPIFTIKHSSTINVTHSSTIKKIINSFKTLAVGRNPSFYFTYICQNSVFYILAVNTNRAKKGCLLL